MTLHRGDIVMTRIPHFLATVADTGVTKVIGKLSDTLKAQPQLNACLKTEIQVA